MSEYNFNEQQDRAKFYGSKEWRGVNGVRRKRLELDNYECVWCKEQGYVTTANDSVLEVDHIYELEHYPKLALHIDNLRTLC